MIGNGHGTGLDSAVFETVLFDRDGKMVTLTPFDFGAVPAGRLRVRQFDVPGSDRGNLGRALLNGRRMSLTSLIDVIFC